MNNSIHDRLQQQHNLLGDIRILYEFLKIRQPIQPAPALQLIPAMPPALGMHPVPTIQPPPLILPAAVIQPTPAIPPAPSMHPALTIQPAPMIHPAPVIPPAPVNATNSATPTTPADLIAQLTHAILQFAEQQPQSDNRSLSAQWLNRLLAQPVEQPQPSNAFHCPIASSSGNLNISAGISNSKNISSNYLTQERIKPEVTLWF